jgi:hypothetical protein
MYQTRQLLALKLRGVLKTFELSKRIKAKAILYGQVLMFVQAAAAC